MGESSSLSDPTIAQALPAKQQGAAPLCGNCRYNLSGLTLPRRCPECGVMAVMPAPEQIGMKRGLLNRDPAVVVRYLGMRRTQRRARRRILFLIVLPCLTIWISLVLVGSTVVATTYDRWLDDRANGIFHDAPDQVVELWRPFGDSWEFGDPRRQYAADGAKGLHVAPAHRSLLWRPPPDDQVVRSTIGLSGFLASPVVIGIVVLLGFCAIGRFNPPVEMLSASTFYAGQNAPPLFALGMAFAIIAAFALAPESVAKYLTPIFVVVYVVVMIAVFVYLGYVGVVLSRLIRGLSHRNANRALIWLCIAVWVLTAVPVSLFCVLFGVALRAAL